MKEVAIFGNFGSFFYILKIYVRANQRVDRKRYRIMDALSFEIS